ncbi:MAG: peptidase M16, partial [Firmicutes bacterium]|nr:peptidase M16 [Bacillota bacterium]
CWGGETKDPDRLEFRILEGLRELRDNGIDPLDFQRARRAMEGGFLRLFDRPDSLAFTFNSLFFRGSSLFDVPKIQREVTLNQAQERLLRLLNPELYAVSVIKPTS